MNDQKILIVTDSSASLPAELTAELNIRVIPLWLVWDNQCYQDGVDIDPHTFYQRLKASKTLPSSTQPSAIEFKEFFQKLAGECEGIVSVLASSNISGTSRASDISDIRKYSILHVCMDFVYFSLLKQPGDWQLCVD